MHLQGRTRHFFYFYFNMSSSNVGQIYPLCPRRLPSCGECHHYIRSIYLYFCAKRAFHCFFLVFDKYFPRTYRMMRRYNILSCVHLYTLGSIKDKSSRMNILWMKLRPSPSSPSFFVALCGTAIPPRGRSTLPTAATVTATRAASARTLARACLPRLSPEQRRW